MISRKQYIEYKLKLASRIGGEGSNLSASDRAQLITELTDIQSNVDSLCKQYEKKFGESFFKTAALVNGEGSVGNGVGVPAPAGAPATPQASAGRSVVPNSPAASSLPPPVTPSTGVKAQLQQQTAATANNASASGLPRSPFPVSSLKKTTA